MVSILIVVVLVAVLGGYWVERRQRKTGSPPGGLAHDVTLDYEREFELYHNALSLCSKKVRVCLAELGIDYRAHPIDLIETGRYDPSLPLAFQIAEVFGLTIEEIFSRD